MSSFRPISANVEGIAGQPGKVKFLTGQNVRNARRVYITDFRIVPTDGFSRSGLMLQTHPGSVQPNDLNDYSKFLILPTWDAVSGTLTQIWQPPGFVFAEIGDQQTKVDTFDFTVLDGAGTPVQFNRLFVRFVIEIVGALDTNVNTDYQKPLQPADPHNMIGKVFLPFGP